MKRRARTVLMLTRLLAVVVNEPLRCRGWDAGPRADILFDDQRWTPSM
jgi:hypothetical protein